MAVAHGRSNRKFRITSSFFLWNFSTPKMGHCCYPGYQPFKVPFFLLLINTCIYVAGPLEYMISYSCDGFDFWE